MIAGTLDNWKQHLAGPVWEKVFDYLASLSPDSPEEKTVLDGDKLFGIVMSYPTREVDDAVLETHEKYIDVQMALVDTEAIDWFPRAGLEVKTPCPSRQHRRLQASDVRTVKSGVSRPRIDVAVRAAARCLRAG